MKILTEPQSLRLCLCLPGFKMLSRGGVSASGGDCEDPLISSPHRGQKVRKQLQWPVGDREACRPEPRLKRAPALNASPQFPRGPAGQEHLFQLFRRSWKSRLDVNYSDFLMLAINSKKCESQGQTKHVSWLNWDVTSDWIQLSSFYERCLKGGWSWPPGVNSGLVWGWSWDQIECAFPSYAVSSVLRPHQ